MATTEIVRTFSDFCDRVDHWTALWRREAYERRRARGEIPEDGFPGELSPWFRGLTDAEHRYEPGVFRSERVPPTHSATPEKLGRVEAYLYDRFTSAARQYLIRESVPTSKLEWLFLMQHHGLPTRLLDWSKGSLIALTFALRKFDKDVDLDAAVWMLEPRRLAEEFNETGERRILTGAEAIVRDYLDLKAGTHSGYPIPLIPKQVTPRLRAQRGRFTLHPGKSGALDRFAKEKRGPGLKPYLVRFVIERADQRRMVRSLRAAGITQTTILPDLDSVAAEIQLRLHLGLDDLSASKQEFEGES